MADEKYNQEFFLALSAKGKDAWNAWRGDPANKDVCVTFAGIDFSEAPRDRIDFSGFEFGDNADFSGCKWRGVIPGWENVWAAFGGFAPGQAHFIGAAFGHWANFTGATFGVSAHFTAVAFGELTDFTGATFGENAVFVGAVFGELTEFTGATFGENANFTGAAFGDWAVFDGTFFKGWVSFTGKSEKQRARLPVSVHWTDAELATLEKRRKEQCKTNGSGPDRFLIISFRRARFDEAVSFDGRSFEKGADFTDARFHYPPGLHAATNVTRIDFTSAHIGFNPPGRQLHWTFDNEILTQLRALRKIADETKNHDLERDLYIEERKAERGVYWHQLVEELKKAPDELKKKLEDINKQKKHVWLEWRLQRRARNAYRLGIAVKIVRLANHGFWIVVMGVYWALADYGRSLVRPTAWLVSSGFFFYWCYGKILAPLMAKAPDIEKYKHAVGMVALGNAVPFVGPLTIDAEIKKFLFCAGDPHCLPIPPEGFQAVVIAQNLVSIILAFFIGLALRNYFRIK